MTVVVRFFAVLREVQGVSSASVRIEPGETVGALYARLFADLVDETGRRLPVMYAVNESYVKGTHLLSAGDEVAFIPPLGGGSGDPRVLLTTAPLDPDQLLSTVQSAERGGVCSFVGTVRNHFDGRGVKELQYEAYEGMARSQMSRLCDEAESRWPGVAIAMHHRLGTLSIGEAAVIITAASPHRDAAFAACRWGIDALKESVPIWKKEIYEEGATWKANEGSSPDARPSDADQPPVEGV